MNTTFSELDTIQWNYQLSLKLIPNTTLLILYFIIGFSGNSVVIYIYRKHMRKCSEERYFIPVLAGVDLLTCTINTASGITEDMLIVNFQNDSVCKFISFISMTFTIFSGLMLVVIAAQRYLMVCKPFEPQMTLKWKRVAVLLAGLVSVVSSFPCFFFYGIKTVRHAESEIYGWRCTSIKGPWTETNSLVFQGYLMIGIIGILLSLIILYSLIGKTIYRQVKLWEKHKVPVSHAQNRSDKENSTSNDKAGDQKNRSFETGYPAEPSSTKVIELSSGDDLDKMAPDNETNVSNNKGDYTVKAQSKTDATTKSSTNNKSAPKLRITLMFMLITGIFILSFIPKIAVMLWESNNDNFWTDLSGGKMVGYRFLYTLYILNSIVNPIIYGFLDTQFNHEFKKLFCRCNIKN